MAPISSSDYVRISYQDTDESDEANAGVIKMLSEYEQNFLRELDN